MEPIRASVRHVPSGGGDFDVFALDWVERHVSVSTGAYNGGDFCLYNATREDIETIKKACDDWLLKGDE